MRLLIPAAARPANSSGQSKRINGIRCVSSADTKRDVPGRGHWFSKGTTYKYHLVANPPLLLLLRHRLLSSSPLLLLPSLARGVYLDNLPLGGSGTRCRKGASSSRWLLSRWHRVPRLWIGDCLLSPLLHLPFLSRSPLVPGEAFWHPPRPCANSDLVIRATALERIPRKIPKRGAAESTEENSRRNLEGDVSMKMSRTLSRDVFKKNFEQHLKEKHVKYVDKFLGEIPLRYFSEIEISMTRAWSQI